MNTVLTVFRKEITDAFRDRRMVMVNFLLVPLLIPIVFGTLTSVGSKQQRERLENPLELPVVGAERAPNLVTWLRAHNVDIEPLDGGLDEAIRAQKFDVGLTIPAGFADDWRKSRPAELQLTFDSSRPTQTGQSIERIGSLLAAYGGELGSLRLIARGIHPGVASPVLVSNRDLALPASSPMVAFFVAYLLLMLSFIGGMHLAMDSTAGERERQSLEPLLATPVSREGIVSGKILATAAFAIASIVTTGVFYKYGFGFFAEEGSRAFVDTSAVLLGQLFAVILPVVLLGAVLTTLLAAQAKSYREAGSYVSLLMFIPMVPVFAGQFLVVKEKLWMFAIPLFAQNQMITRLVRGESLSTQEWALGMGSGMALVLVAWLIAARLYRREQLAISG
jgi:sodium transport system permease protein